MSQSGHGLLAGCALGLASGWNIGNIGAVASELGQTYGVGLATVGLLTTALMVGHAAIQVPGGKAIDRFGPFRAGLVALGLIGVGDLVALMAPDPALALAGRAITGTGTGLVFIAGSTLVRSSGGSPSAQGLFGGVALGSAGLALALVPHAAAELAWRAPYWTSLGVAAAATLVLVAGGDVLRRHEGPRRRPRRTGAGVLRRADLYRLAFLYSASYAVSVVLGNWVVEYLQRHGTLRGGAAAAVGALTLALTVATRPFGGWVLQRHPDQARRAVGASLLAGGAGTLALLWSRPSWLAATGAALVGIGAGISFAPAFTGAALVVADAPAAAVGFVNGIANAVVLAGTPLVGLTFAIPGEGRVGFAAVAVLWFVALALLPSRAALGAVSASGGVVARGSRTGPAP